MNYADFIGAYKYIKNRMLAEPDGYSNGKVYVRSGMNWEKKEEKKNVRTRKDGAV